MASACLGRNGFYWQAHNKISRLCHWILATVVDRNWMRCRCFGAKSRGGWRTDFQKDPMIHYHWFHLVLRRLNWRTHWPLFPILITDTAAHHQICICIFLYFTKNRNPSNNNNGRALAERTREKKECPLCKCQLADVHRFVKAVIVSLLFSPLYFRLFNFLSHQNKIIRNTERSEAREWDSKIRRERKKPFDMLFISIIYTNNNWSAQTNGRFSLTYAYWSACTFTSLNPEIKADARSHKIEISGNGHQSLIEIQPTFRCDRIFFCSLFDGFFFIRLGCGTVWSGLIRGD